MTTKRKPRATLTGKQRAFVLAYCSNGFNGVRAARTAGYKGSYSALGVIAHENIKNPKVQDAINKHFKQSAMGADEVIARLSEIARGDLADVLNPDGTFDIKRARARGKSYLIKEQKIEEKFIPQEGGDDILIRTITIKIHDAHAALRDLGKIHSLFVDRQQIDDWRSLAVDALRKGEVTPAAVEKELGADLAHELFALAGVKVE